jgi:hypothetical protein
MKYLHLITHLPIFSPLPLETTQALAANLVKKQLI